MTDRTCPDVEALTTLARALAAVESVQDLQEALGGPVDAVLPKRDLCVLAAAGETWRTVAGPQGAHRRSGSYDWIPLRAGEKTVGMLGIEVVSPETPSERLTEGASVLLQLVVRNVLAFEDLNRTTSGVASAATSS